VDADSLNDVLVLVESLTLVDVDSLNDVLVLAESLTLVDVDSLNDVLALVEILTLTDSDAKYEGKSNSGNDVLSGLPILCDSDAL
ncbi:hypothetical protein, partial [Staphylococcus hominis]|uniref:hypothetical protein n=1 Tax=Staphylococcus hominis TaxID=1290 RepID=UPI0023B12EA6